MKFCDLGIHAPILKALAEVGYQTPTPIQEKAMPPVLSGRDLLGCAQTGTGKTAAFSVPILQRLCTRPGQGVRALILTPTRELALQIYENVCQYARYTPCSAAVIFGGVSQIPQVDALRRGADVLVATPGRLWDLMGQKLVSLAHVECFVLDEADRMLDMGFIHDVRRIADFIPKNRQTLLFSATMPQEIAALADSLLHNPVRISIQPAATPVELIEQQVYLVERAEKRDLLKALLLEKGTPQTLVFTRTKHGADRVARELNRAGIPARALHGDKSQGARQTALRDFKDDKISALVATDIAARGLDISELPLVVNFELPNIPETYVHRIGRTGRAGLTGVAISFCDSTERPYLADIEKLTRQHIPVAETLPDRSLLAALPRPTSRRTSLASRRAASPSESVVSAVPEAPRGRATRRVTPSSEPVVSAVPEAPRGRATRRVTPSSEPVVSAVPEAPRGRVTRRAAPPSEPVVSAVPEAPRGRATRRVTPPSEPVVSAVPEAPRGRVTRRAAPSSEPVVPTISNPPRNPRPTPQDPPHSKNNQRRTGNHSAAAPSNRQRRSARSARPGRDRDERPEDNTRVDIATPVNPSRISAEAAARIRAKVEAKLAERARAQSEGTSRRAVPPSRKPAARRPQRGRKR